MAAQMLIILCSLTCFLKILGIKQVGLPYLQFNSINSNIYSYTHREILFQTIGWWNLLVRLKR